MDRYDVFISYRRDGGEMLAHILYERMKDAGYYVFQDVESLRSGDFNTALYDVIENCQDFILVLSPGALDRCSNPDDWVKNEIVYALEHKKNIIPIMMRGFEWPEYLPPDIDIIRYKNGLTASTEYFDNFIKKLQTFLSSKKTSKLCKGKSTACALRSKQLTAGASPRPTIKTTLLSNKSSRKLHLQPRRRR